MRLFTFEIDAEPVLGAAIDDTHLIDLGTAAALVRKRKSMFTSMLTLIDAGAEGLDVARCILEAPPDAAIIAKESVRLLSPLPQPRHIRDFVCFEDHLRNGLEKILEMEAAKADDPVAERERLKATGKFEIADVFYKQPLYYNASRMGVGGHEDDVFWPAYSTVMDYELEFAAVIGRKIKDATTEQAKDAIFGYTIFNDFTARDEQMIAAEGRLGMGKGKDFDGGNVFGPCIVTADELTQPYNLEMVARVNGEEWSRGNSGSMHWKFEDAIAHVSQSEAIWPGEIICSGTVGTGCGVELGRFLSDGDVVELEVERIGILQNRIVVTTE